MKAKTQDRIEYIKEFRRVTLKKTMISGFHLRMRWIE
jgi:hypothetical protein